MDFKFSDMLTEAKKIDEKTRAEFEDALNKEYRGISSRGSNSPKFEVSITGDSFNVYIANRGAGISDAVNKVAKRFGFTDIKYIPDMMSCEFIVK
jgi:hypothetical protein